MKRRFWLLLLIGCLLLSGCGQTQLPSEQTTAPSAESTAAPTVAPTVSTTAPTTAPTTPATEPEPPAWLRKEAYPSYEAYFAEDREYGYFASQAESPQLCSWYIMDGDAGTVYDLSLENSTPPYPPSLYLTDHSTGERQWLIVPGDLFSYKLLGCDGRYAYFRRSDNLPYWQAEIARLDLETRKMEPLFQCDELLKLYLCGDAVMYFICETAGVLQLCRMYLPEARLDRLCTLDFEPGHFLYSLQRPQSTLGDVTWSVAASETEIVYRETYRCADGTVTREPFRQESLTAAPEPTLVEGEWRFIGTELQGAPTAEMPENAAAVILGNGFKAGNPGYCAEGKLTRLSEDMALEAVEGAEGVFCITEENTVLQLAWDGSIRNVLYTGGEKPLGSLVYREGFLYLTEGENILQLRAEDGASRVLIHQPGLYQLRLEQEDGLYFRGGAFKAYVYYFGADDFYETT